MRNILMASVAALLCATAQPAFTQGKPMTETQLIERSKLFGNPVKAQGRFSPDGKWVSWLAPSNGVLNIWVAPAADLNKARPLTAETKRPIRQHFWAPDSSMILFINDAGGNEDFLLYGVRAEGGEPKLLTDFEKTTVQVVGLSERHPERILIGLNNRDQKWHDVWSLDLGSGKLTEVQRNDGYSGFLADEDLVLRLAIRPNAAGGQDYFRLDNGKVADKPFLSHGLDDSQTTTVLGFSADGRTLYLMDSRDRDTGALFAMDWASGKTTLVAEDARADMGGTLINPKSKAVEAVSFDYLKPEWKVLDQAVAADIAFLNEKLGNWLLSSRTQADDRWIVTTDNSKEAAASFVYDRKAKALTKLFDTRPDLVGAPLAEMRPVEIKARDGKTLVSYLTLPAGAGEKPAKPLPMVLLVHGGPWARDSYGYDALSQFLANRGYAVLQVNFRGSTGFGKGFTNAGNGEWGAKMHDDLIDAVNWAVGEGHADPARVAIMGGSYGGYATLAGLTFTPTTFACGVDIVGPSNLQTLLSTVPPYWESFYKQLVARMGDPKTPEGQKWLKERSPLTHAERIQRPLLIGQGANDPRVKQAESDQIVAAMQAKNIPVTYVLFPDEGHGFARPENSIAFMAVAENFLAKCLGGQAEAIGGTVKASSAEVPHGAEYAPGLKAALAAK
ncbi:S9 family peptidase [Sandaracinobacter sp. RS1-74]|uniref:S9 family peptidase n=1 Tax=Sandaracinobacteroides sayramensis TaxID=2913411 RepID=UPI001EDA1868|nr:S9 family peptidase [Sandaracinobacteroides sayramensis]MCG2841058.1 S9 family peptidase [Sandaracinobacteroides sayramensis]